MNVHATPDAYGALIEPATLKIQRLLPGPIERVWAYLTESDLRRQWLAAGEMEVKEGAAFTLTWRNAELGGTPEERPEGMPDEHSMESRVIEADPPHKLVFAWGDNGDVSITLEPRGERVLLTLIHRRLRDRNTSVMVGAGWHAHLDVLVARMNGEQTTSFWKTWVRLRADYEKRIPA